MRIFVVTLLFLYFVLVNSANCLFKNVLSRFYCNSENCYSILGVGENATVNDIRIYDLNTKRKVEEDIEIKVFQEMELSDKKPTQSKNSGSGSSGGGSNGGSGSVTDLLIVQLLLLPKYILFYILWNIKWVVKYTILKEEYDDCDKMYITRKCMNIPLKKWNILREDEKKMLMKKKLWIKENQEEFFEEIKEKQRLHKISSAKYKKQMRMKKKGFSFNYND
ncbi:hypothetical protein POVWA2_029130 [Plasmodium ovale wallikeri]|uniref:Uncharacterized protein n=1 Tax=Plasmodium ovale wallikeri TaxID=864142 RepID=A0A1A8YW15_PLAOA|nr:hypothetical protein POVWA1_029390 [Plasmodium ovale wallikeri]SBT36234.1 hypothetical protein POVWA2_029130 [Plasmodium ovale wallikeri]